MDGKAVYTLEQVVVRYGEKRVVDIPSYAFQAQKVYALVGANGAGKTTLLHIFAFLKKPTQGKISFFGEEGEGGKKQQAMRQKVSLVLQEPYLFLGTVEENVAYGPRHRGLRRPQVQPLVEAALAQVGLSGYEAREVRTLSGGEAKRVALARALAFDPEVLLLDEATANLDRESVENIGRFLMYQQKARQKSIIFTTHDEAFALKCADEVVLINQGRLLPFTSENLLKGTVQREGDIHWFVHPSGLRIEVATSKVGPAILSVEPREIVLSRAPFESSARNCFTGRITRLEEAPDSITAVVHVNSEVELVAHITAHAYRELKLHVGESATATFKASVVKVE